jgi:hypothetical protein
MNVEAILTRAEQAVHRGQLWRAKEILQGTIRSRRYDPVMFERLGTVLLQMGDLPEAGKYLFLCGRREAAYNEAIALFLRRFRRTRPLQLYSAFPRAARLAHRGDYPPSVETELEQLGLPELLPAPRRRLDTATRLDAPLVGVGCFAGVILILGLAVVGAISLVQWMLG